MELLIIPKLSKILTSLIVKGSVPSTKASMILPFLFASMVSCLKTYANVSAVEQNVSDSYAATDYSLAKKGLLSDGVSTFCSGALGGMGVNTAVASVGLSISTGVFSRCIGQLLGGVFLLLAFFPKVLVVLTMIPQSVEGAILLFLVCLVINSGIVEPKLVNPVISPEVPVTTASLKNSKAIKPVNRTPDAM